MKFRRRKLITVDVTDTHEQLPTAHPSDSSAEPMAFGVVRK